MPGIPFRIYKIESRPIMIIKTFPDCVVIIYCNREINLHVVYGPADVIYVFFERKLRSMYADNNQSLVFIFFNPRTYIRQRTDPIYTGIGSKLNQHYFPSKIGCSKRRG